MEGGVDRLSGEDRISSLPEELLCLILDSLTLKDVVRTSVLSSRWRYFWLRVPRLELNISDFPNYDTCVSFLDKFHNGSNLSEFNLNVERHVLGFKDSVFEPCLSRVLKHKIQRFEVVNRMYRIQKIPLTLSVCEALVSIRLHMVRLNDFESLSLPCLKIMHLEHVQFPTNDAVVMLVSCSPVLEELVIILNWTTDDVGDIRVYSKSLKILSLTLFGLTSNVPYGEAVVIDAPRLKYLSLNGCHCRNCKITNMGASIKVDIDVTFDSTDNLWRHRDIVHNFFNNFSCAVEMTIAWGTLWCIQINRDFNPLPKFHDMSRLRVSMPSEATPKLVPSILESCPNLKYLTMELFPYSIEAEKSGPPPAVLPRCLVSSLESVDIESPITRKATELKLVRYFLENSATLKKLALRLDHECTRYKHKPGVLKQLFEIPRRSNLCQFVILKTTH
ncbi:PREDICTED: F-box/FBD/LRR-repeat protein At5g18770-like [Camelina sativa]|uniref:F-box/FBD/LRR-repeat protein At5g18770-like n=1 Tax=Camelina sativa TaxID=90675 RepID=A0ABM1REE0_CAMSA|nr:PREDICTED: F-box/FBD/LRR-repeat protein At5g18770-like [Camelina sativa]